MTATTPSGASTATTGRKVAMLADVAAERRDLADRLDSLDAADWATPSLCGEWNVHQVLAHLTLSIRQKVMPTVWRVLKARGDYEAAEARMARDYAAANGTGELIARFRDLADLDSRFILGGKLDPLVDVLVHGQDIARPLGHHRPMPTHRVLPALEHVWGSRFYGNAGRFAGLRFTATDADWSMGEGPEVRCPAGDILLAATGRPAGLQAATGPGAAVAAARLA